MSPRRSLLYAALLVASLLAPPVAAQDASPAPGDLQREQLAEVTLPQDALPPSIEAISWEEIRVGPRVDAAIPARARYQARVMSVATGRVQVTFDVPSMVWRAGSAPGATSDSRAASEPVTLATGDVLYIPWIPASERNPDGQARITNLGDDPALVVGIHLSDTPVVRVAADVEGIRTISRPLLLGEAHRFGTGNISVDLSRLTLAPGDSLTPPVIGPGAAFYEVTEGSVEYAWTTPDRSATLTSSWAPLMGGWFPWADGVMVRFSPLGDGPAVVLELTVTQA